MSQETPFDFLKEALQEIAYDIIAFLPKIILVLIVLIITFLIIRLVNSLFSRILKLVDLDGMLKKIGKIELPFSLNNLIILLIDVGIVLIALFGLANYFLELQQLSIVKEAFQYSSRILSDLFIILIIFFLFNILIGKVTVQTRMRGYIMFILLILITMMIFDLASLSPLTQQELQKGLSLGLGITIGVFAIWFFFHDYLDKLVSQKKSK
ncbi:MAG: hypothetical protein NWF08_04530 [Candidatus Bathyarchaeota archaeon]|nr:hypothetical protein [Candidatus Bathyarchaeota archaeon]